MIALFTVFDRRLGNSLNCNFAAGEYRGIIESITVELIRNTRWTIEQPVVRHVDTNTVDDPERASSLETQQNFPHGLYSLLRFSKIVSSAWAERFPGWRSGLVGFIILASIVLISNICALAWAASHLEENGYHATLLTSSYERISNVSGWAHITVNVLSTTLLAGSNYCMQCLSSPTRADVDAAHARGSYLDIGILS